MPFSGLDDSFLTRTGRLIFYGITRSFLRNDFLMIRVYPYRFCITLSYNLIVVKPLGGIMKYVINDLQGGNFCEWSYEEPATRLEIIEHFNTFRIDEGMDLPKKKLSLRLISFIWGVEFERVKA
jgi:hypothetical protein